MKRLVFLVLIGIIAVSFAFSSGSSAAGTQTRQEVNFWYLWSGKEGENLEEIIKAYNESQTKYTVIGLSTPDMSKVIAGISGGNGPDVSDDFHRNIPLYAQENIAAPLDDLLARDNISTDNFAKAYMDLMYHDKKIYGLPMIIDVGGIFYNKDLLAKAGITELPKTLEELQQMIHDLTIVENGEIKQLGGIFVSYGESWTNSWAQAYGSNFGTVGNLNPANEGFRKALEWYESEIRHFGQPAMNNFITSGMSSMVSPNDPFMRGTMVFYLSGSWTPNFARAAGINYGVMALPGSERNPGTKGFITPSSSIWYLPSTARNKEGGWDFLKYIATGEGAKLFSIAWGGVPSYRPLMTDPDIARAIPDIDYYMDIINNGTIVNGLPSWTGTSQYLKALSDATAAIRLGKTANQALEELLVAVNAIVE